MSDIRIERNLLNLLHRQARASWPISVFVGTLLSLILKDAVEHNILISWLVALYSLATIRWLHGRLYTAYPPADKDICKWKYSFMGFVALAGCVWGYVGAFIVPIESTEHFTATIAILIGMVGGMQSSAGVFLFFAIPTLLPIAIRMLLLDDSTYIIMGILTLFYIVASLFFQRPRQRALINSYQLRYENLDLVERLKEQKATAEKANIEKSKFLAAASHDLRQPLHSLELFFESLRSEVHTEKGNQLVDQVGISLEALRQLFGALLDISRLDAGIIEVKRKHFSLSELLEQLTREFTPLAHQQNRAFERVCSSPIVFTDRILLERIVRNLLSNALQHGEGTILLKTKVSDQTVSLTVSDEGPGMPESELQNIFLEYHQLDNPERDRSKGLGLGLAIVSRITHLLNHDLKVNSALGQGSEFTLTLPLGDQESIESDDEQKNLHQWDLTGTNVLAIDDEAIILTSMQTLLEGWGCRVSCAENLESALSEIKQGNAPDLIISDYRMRQNRTGLEVIEQLQAQLGKSVPTILVTGDTSPERLREAHASQLTLLHKPVRPPVLRMAMVRALQSKASE